MRKNKLEKSDQGVLGASVLDRRTHELVNIPMSREFVALLASELPRLGYSNRSDFVRQAIVEKLAAEGVAVPLEYVTAPSRVKPRQTAYGMGMPSAAIMNEHPGVSPERARELETMVARQAAEDAARLRSRRGDRPSGAGAKRGAAKAKPST